MEGKSKMSRLKVTKEIAQARVSKIGRDITIIEWNGISKPCIVKCNKCGLESEASRGSSTYSKNSRYFQWLSCFGCENKVKEESIKEYIEYTNMESRAIDESIEQIREQIRDYIGKEVVAKELVEEICTSIKITPLSVIRFNFSILDRVCDYEEIKINKFGKKGYLIKDVLKKSLPKTKERIELEEKVTRIANGERK